MPVVPPVALLGTGLLGSAIATRLLQQGESLWVWNRTPERCTPLLELGARGAGDPAAAVALAHWVITVLSDGPTTQALLTGKLTSPLFHFEFHEIEPIHDAFKPMAREQRFDVSEMAVFTFLQA
jgi:nucleoside-diphosphate-sugar epimerase